MIFGYFEYEEIPIYNLKVAYKFILGETNYKPYDNLIGRLGYSKNDKASNDSVFSIKLKSIINF